MNQNLGLLCQIAAKSDLYCLGLMSGTSMDGLDIAFCKFTGSGIDTEVDVLAFETMPFEESVKQEIRQIFAKETISFQQLCVLNPWIGNLHGELILAFLEKHNINKSSVDCIASHGQTVFHAPKILHNNSKFPNATLQIGDGDHIAVKTGILTLSDFRQKHCAAGGEGAPLAVYGDYLLFTKQGETRILLNMGGISNYTYLPSNADPNLVFATDTGTGNTLIDAYVQHHFNVPFDKDAELALKGEVNSNLLKALKDNAFFSKDLPKTTGPELFNLSYLENAQKLSGTLEISHFDVLATLCRFTAETIVEAFPTNLDKNTSIYTSGGGAHNPLIMKYLYELLPKYRFNDFKVLGVSGDAKEAVLFATLANETLKGGKTNFGTRQGVPSISMGKISFAH